MSGAKNRVLDANQIFVGTEPNWKGVDPESIRKNLKLILIQSLNWYAANSGAKESLEYFKRYFPKEKVTHATTVGFLCRMVFRGFPKELIWEKIESLAKRLPREEPKKKEEDPVQKKIHKETIDPIPENICEEIDYFIDKVIRKESVIPTFAISGLSEKQINKISSFVEKQIAEFDGASSRKIDGELIFGISKRQENAIVGPLRKLQLQLSTMLPEKKQRKQRKKKEIPVERIVGGFPVVDFGAIETINNTKIHNASLLVLYEAKTRRLSVVFADDNALLSVKGKSIINYNEAKSFGKILRKPEEQIPLLIKFSKSAIIKEIEKIRSVKGLPKIRSTETTTLLKVW